MAKTSSIVKFKRNKEKVARFRAYYLELKEKIRDPKTSPEERSEAQVKLQKLPRNALAVRLRNRCQLTGRV